MWICFAESLAVILRVEFKVNWQQPAKSTGICLPATISAALSPKPLSLFPTETLVCSVTPEQHDSHSDPSHRPNLQPWSAAPTMKFCTHFIPINKVKELLRGEARPASSEAWRRRTEGRWEEGGVGTTKDLRFEIIRDQPAASSRFGLGDFFTWDVVRSQIETRTHVTCQSLQELNNIIEKVCRLLGQKGRGQNSVEEEKPQGRFLSASERSVKLTCSTNTHKSITTWGNTIH